MQDTSPERRNLMVTSLSFIIFYYGKGKIIDETVIRIQIINIQFDNLVFLVVLAWIMLIWFYIRYWQSHKNNFRDNSRGEIVELLRHKYVINYVQKITGMEYQVDGGFELGSMTFQNGYFYINYETSIKNVKFNELGIHIGHKSGKPKRTYIKGLLGYELLFNMYMFNAIHKNAFTSYFVPNLIFFIAITAPIFN